MAVVFVWDNLFFIRKNMSKPYKRNGEVIDMSVFPEGMQRLAMGIEYNGELFRGFQSQTSGVPTVQQALEEALSSICDEKITLVCAGRTDMGVHATNQVIHFDTLAERPDRAWLRGANTQLTTGISIHWVKKVTPFFHSRFSAQARTYRYIIFNNPTPSALMDGLVTWDRRRLNLSAMQIGSQFLLGEHDFSAFRGADCQAKNPVRRIDKIEICRMGQFIVIEVMATAFLYHMVRNIVGVLTAVAAGDKPIEWVQEVLSSKDRRNGGVTAPAAGLYLVQVDYDADFDLPAQSKGPSIVSNLDLNS
jgi:tRNA pseudouridine38-40 synthase